MRRSRDSETRGTGRSVRPRTGRTAGALATVAMLLALTSCDGVPGGPQTTTAPPAGPMDPAVVADTATTTVDPSWLCDPGGDAEAPAHSGDPGVFSPEAVHVEGNDVMISGPFQLEDGFTYGGFAPDAVIVPAHPANRGVAAPGYDVELGTHDAPVPPIVVRERVEVPGEGAAPTAATARLTLGTCDDAPLPDGQYLLTLSGGLVDGPGRGDEAGWSSSQDVLLDVVDGRLRAVPGAVSAPDGEIPADVSPLGCRARLTSIGDGDGLTVSVSDPTTSVSTLVPDSEIGVGVDADVTVTSEGLGTRVLLQGIVVTSPSTGTVVAGARNAPTVGLQWIDEDGVSNSETAWVTRLTCTHSPLRAGAYEAYAFAVTVDEAGATHVVLSEPWIVDVSDDPPAT